MAAGFGEHSDPYSLPEYPSAAKVPFTQPGVEIPFEKAFADLGKGWLVCGSPAQPRLHEIENPGTQGAPQTSGSSTSILGYLPPTPPELLGDRHFTRQHQLRHAYVGGSMANGIASVDLVSALASSGNLAFYGAAGQTPNRVEEAIDELNRRHPGGTWGSNLIHSPSEPTIESDVAELLLKRRVRHVEASAYIDLTEPLVKMRLKSLRRLASGEVISDLSIMAKASRLEVASKFLSPAPEEWVQRWLQQGEITEDQANWAREWPICDDLTAEADSGGHTDNRPLSTLVPAFCDLRDRLGKALPRVNSVRIGAAGGLGSPAAIAAAFALGAGYVVVGSVHQSCVESGTSDVVREHLAKAGPADVIMAPASDMFEMGVHLQVLRRGTMFGPRAKRLLELYRNHSSLEELSSSDRQRIEKEIFRMPLEEVWQLTRQFFLEREPSQVQRAEEDAHHKMALVFRWYLGKSSDWANRGIADRALDYQVWCGPAMGAFNEWVQGSSLEHASSRKVATVAEALMQGAALHWRLLDLQRMGCSIPVGPWATPDFALQTFTPDNQPNSAVRYR